MFPDETAKTRPWSAGGPGPILVWQAGAAGYAGEGKGVVYLGHPDGVPEPCDLPAMLTLSLGRVLRLASEFSSQSRRRDLMDDWFWEELAELDPDDVCRRSGARQEGGSYLIRVLGRDCLLTPCERRLLHVDVDQGEEEEEGASTLCFAVVHHLLNARRIPQSGELVTAAELKGGKLFFAAGAHSPDFSALEGAFSMSPQVVERAAEALGGRGVAHGDAAVEIPALPRLPITFVFWRADEDFPASTSMLFDRTADQQLPLDVILSLAQETMRRLVLHARH